MIKIGIVEDHTLFREGIKSLLANWDDFDIIAEFSNGREFIESLHSLNLDVVLMDVEMPVMNGIEASKEAIIKKPDLKILALSMYSDQSYYYEMIKSGISGFVLKNASAHELEKAIRDVYNGLGFFSPKLLKEALIQSSSAEKRDKVIGKLKLSERELEVLDLICQGLTSNEISDKLFLSPRTVDSHKARIMHKTKTRNTASLVIFSIKNELIQI
ncbi:MAG: response regulator transcription factor [Bacteroidales bacterium]|nr:response regulator transcription factor [Bacteroidales bacterium]